MQAETAFKVCTKCGKAKPATREYFFNAGTREKPRLRGDCKECTKAAKIMRREHPKHRGDNEDSNGFVWNKITQSRFTKIAEVITNNSLTPQEILGMSPARARELSYNLGAKLKVVKYSIRTAHPEAMAILFPPIITELQDEAPIIEPTPIPPEAPMTLKHAAELLLTVESRLEAANIDLETAKNMLRDAEEAIVSIKAERREAVRLVSDMARELELDD